MKRHLIPFHCSVDAAIASKRAEHVEAADLNGNVTVPDHFSSATS
jgi:hypothetical protein